MVGDRTGLTEEVEVGWRIKKTIYWGVEGKINIRKDMTSSAHSEAMPYIAHDDQPRSLHNSINILSKTTFLKGSKSYRLVSTFVRSRHRALTVRPCHRALTMINIDHYINTLDEAFH